MTRPPLTAAAFGMDLHAATRASLLTPLAIAATMTPMAALTPGHFDRWRSDGWCDEERAHDLAEFIELRGRSADEVQIRHTYFDLLALGPGDRVLEVGCATGVVARDIARRVTPGGRVTGLDTNAQLLVTAKRLAAQHDIDGATEWQVGDACGLPFADASFDVVVCATVLVHVPNSERVVPELLRVLRPGGRIGILEPDPESSILEHPDRPLTRRIVGAAAALGFADAFVGRRVPALLRQAGADGVQLRAFVALEVDPAGHAARAAELLPLMAARSGAVTRGDCDAWLASFRREKQSGRFLGGTTYLFTWATMRGPA